jgi:hypothetical protein
MRAACFLLGRFLLLKKGVGINMNLMNCESGGRFDYGKYCLQISSISAVMLFVSIALRLEEDRRKFIQDIRFVSDVAQFHRTGGGIQK